MKFDKYFPSISLRPYIKHYVVSENELESSYKVFPSSGLVIGFQYQGKLSHVQLGLESQLSSAGISGITDSYTVFKNSAGIGTILVYFTEIGFAHFTVLPAHELFNMSISLELVFDKSAVARLEESLVFAKTDSQRIVLVDDFLIAQLKEIETDRLIVEAVAQIYRSKGSIRIKELNDKLGISQSAFEKRFRKVVGTTAKKFASIVRFNAVLDDMSESKSLQEICYENNFFDQAHFIKDFKQFTGDTPDNFKRFSSTTNLP